MQYPKFVSNSNFYHMDNSKSDLQQLVAIAENLKAVHLLTAKHYDSFEQLIADYLKSGIEIFQMQTGIVSHISEDKKYTVKDVVTDLEVIHPGDEYELEGTYCREVYQTGETIGFPRVADIKELKDHPVYVNLKLEAYLSAPIFVNDELYGTLNFTSLIPREHGFSEHENDLISMMAASIGNFILLQEKEEKLKKKNIRISELIGYVSHDLRNPLGSINGLSKIALSRELSQEKIKSFFESIENTSARGLELVNTILNQAALSSGKITLEKSNFNLLNFINDILDAFSLLIKERKLNIVLEIDSDLIVYSDKARISQVFHNLLINAFKYSASDSEIKVNCYKEDSHIRCYISNIKSSDGVDSLDDGIYKSIGYGLHIVEDILQLHGTELKISQDEKNYSVSFDLEPS
ncbi:GAF sensor signal transduction histidine kinase [Sulfurimonas gotlandica GD1]|uniref:histidine kinase n=1 Tax=Sulfurimonas gotlandica (strain DSM 19862 / JCM 16533 / GD1) TaxID=929558 RepID=B6BHH9_SULGG|nr:GAF domain-containing sensor histidine kinase [Sulfurimonas gotlandica]EDZ63738.1 histidine kinase A domain protein [Sulfurimonas gotlandica GD1]EHP29976.1 GAF sensor signal transduction histidine kinase [Sulfurimonas gotlandica GD1]